MPSYGLTFDHLIDSFCKDASFEQAIGRSRQWIDEHRFEYPAEGLKHLTYIQESEIKFRYEHL